MELSDLQRPDFFKVLFLSGDQPTTCPKCGARTDFILDMSHTINETIIHQCLSPYCEFVFVQVGDVENIIFE